jgi:hypothetical protein
LSVWIYSRLTCSTGSKLSGTGSGEMEWRGGRKPSSFQAQDPASHTPAFSLLQHRSHKMSQQTLIEHLQVLRIFRHGFYYHSTKLSGSVTSRYVPWSNTESKKID